MEFEQEYFDSAYRNYFQQNPTYKLLYYIRKIQQHNPKAKTLLDVGCGLGYLLKIAEEQYQVFGTDVSEYCVGEVQKFIGNTHVKLGSAENIPFKGRFDVITLFDVIEHVPNLEKALGQINKSLQKGGVTVFVMPVYDGLVGRMVEALDKDKTHVNKFSREKWLDLISQKFEVLEWVGIFRYLLPFGYYLNIPTKALRQYSPAILVVARKKTLAGVVRSRRKLDKAK